MKTPARLTSTDRARAYEQRLRASGGYVGKVRLDAALTARLDAYARDHGGATNRSAALTLLIQQTLDQKQ
jgi:hypothetical protein